MRTVLTLAILAITTAAYSQQVPRGYQLDLQNEIAGISNSYDLRIPELPSYTPTPRFDLDAMPRRHNCMPARLVMLFTNSNSHPITQQLTSYQRTVTNNKFFGSNISRTIDNHHNKVRRVDVRYNGGANIARQWGVTSFPTVLYLQAPATYGSFYRITHIYNEPNVRLTASRNRQPMPSASNVARGIMGFVDSRYRQRTSR